MNQLTFLAMIISIQFEQTISQQTVRNISRSEPFLFSYLSAYLLDVRMGESSTLEFPTTIMKAINMEDLSYETARIDVSSEHSNSSSSYSDAVMTSQSTSMDETSEPILAPLATEDEIELQEYSLLSPNFQRLKNTII